MCRSQRLQGLELLRAVGAPTPDWHVVKNSIDASTLSLGASEAGWTIRTCRSDGVKESGLFHSHHLAPAEVVAVLVRRLGNQGNGEFFIVYPSWQFKFSCNILSSNLEYFVEGMYGSQKSLSMGKASPDFSLEGAHRRRSSLHISSGAPPKDVLSHVGRMLYWCDKIPSNDFYCEAAVTSKGVSIFYELFLH